MNFLRAQDLIVLCQNLSCCSPTQNAELEGKGLNSECWRGRCWQWTHTCVRPQSYINSDSAHVGSALILAPSEQTRPRKFPPIYLYGNCLQTHLEAISQPQNWKSSGKWKAINFPSVWEINRWAEGRPLCSHPQENEMILPVLSLLGTSHSCWTAAPTAPAFEVCGTPKGFRNQQQKFWENPVCFFFPLLSTGLTFPTAVMIKDAFWSWRLWIILSTSYHFISPRPPFITVIPTRAVCPPGYVNPFPVISLAYSMSLPINYIKNKAGWWKKKKMFHILHAVSGQEVFVPTSLMKWKKVNI